MKQSQLNFGFLAPNSSPVQKAPKAKPAPKLAAKAPAKAATKKITKLTVAAQPKAKADKKSVPKAPKQIKSQKLGKGKGGKQTGNSDQKLSVKALSNIDSVSTRETRGTGNKSTEKIVQISSKSKKITKPKQTKPKASSAKPEMKNVLIEPETNAFDIDKKSFKPSARQSLQSKAPQQRSNRQSLKPNVS